MLVEYTTIKSMETRWGVACWLCTALALLTVTELTTAMDCICTLLTVINPTSLLPYYPFLATPCSDVGLIQVLLVTLIILYML